MLIAGYVTAAAVLLLDLFSHRLQRAALAVANLTVQDKTCLTVQDRACLPEIARLQLLMTPDWIGKLTLLEYLFAVFTFILFCAERAWVPLVVIAIVYLLGLFAGVLGVFVALMPHQWNLKMISKYLNSRLVALTLQGGEDGTTNSYEIVRLKSTADNLRSEALACDSIVEANAVEASRRRAI